MDAAFLRDRRDLCRKLRDISDRQRDALAGRDYDALIGLLGEKGTLLDRLAGMAPSVGDWVTRREQSQDERRAEADALFTEANGLLEQAAVAENHAVIELTSQRDGTQQELREIGAAGRVHSAYRDALAPVTHRSLDVDR